MQWYSPLQNNCPNLYRLLWRLLTTPSRVSDTISEMNYTAPRAGPGHGRARTPSPLEWLRTPCTKLTATDAPIGRQGALASRCGVQKVILLNQPAHYIRYAPYLIAGDVAIIT